MKPKATVKTGTTRGGKMKTFSEIRAHMPKGAHVRVGVLAGSGDHDGISMIELAAIHEFGSPAANIPERSFIRSTFARTDIVDGLNRQAAALARAIVAGKLTADVALGRIGAWAAAQIKGTIRNKMTEGPEDQALKPATIARKKSSTPLVDTGRLLGAISWLVKGS